MRSETSVLQLSGQVRESYVQPSQPLLKGALYQEQSSDESYAGWNARVGLPGHPLTRQPLEDVLSRYDAGHSATFPGPEGNWWNPQQDDDADNIGNACDLVIPPQFVSNAWLGNQNYSHQLTVLRCQQQPCTWEMISGFLPNALTADSFGTISGSVLAGGFTATFTMKVTDATGDTDTRVLKIKAKIPRCYNCHSAASF